MVKRLSVAFRSSPMDFISAEEAENHVIIFFGDAVGSGHRGYAVGKIDSVRQLKNDGSDDGMFQSYPIFQQGNSHNGCVAQAIALNFGDSIESGRRIEFSISCYYKANLIEQSAEIVWSEAASDEDVENLIRMVNSALSDENEDSSLLNNRDDFLFTHELTLEEYKEKFDRIKEDIRSGRYYEINFTHRVEGVSGRSPWKVFSDMLRLMESRYAAWFPLGERHILSASPELFFSINDRKIQTAPIKGSVITEKPSEENLTEKLKAEHIMVVDLARNDVGRISRYGTVRPDPMLAWEKFGRLYHLVSVVHGELSTDSFREILEAMHPAASITGTPKIEVLKAIREYEKTERGIYTGSLGWMDADGLATFNVAIRTLDCRRLSAGQYAYILGVGGAIVDDSDAEEEYKECLAKAEPLIEILKAQE